jgi:transcriptional regulator with XRE-family HTH domain
MVSWRASRERQVRMNDFPGKLRALMAERGLSTYAVARKVPCDPSLISRYRSGRQKPSERMAGLLDKALGADGELIRLANLARPGRRAVLAGGLLAGGLISISPETVGRLAWAQGHPARIDMAVVQSLADVLAAQRRAEDALGAPVVLRPVLAQVAMVEELVRQARGPARPALVDVAQQWAQFAGWLCWDTGDLNGVRAYSGQALEWATELNDASMRATVLVQSGYRNLMTSDAGSMIGFGAAAQRDPRAAAGHRAYAADLEARGHALAGNAEAADRKLGEAEELAAHAEEPGNRRPWSYWMTPAFFRREEGIISAFLAGAGPAWHRRAVDCLTTDLPTGETTLRTPALGLTWLALAHAQAGLVDEACGTAVSAAGAVRQSGSARLMDILHRVHADLVTRHPGDARVADLAEALR